MNKEQELSGYVREFWRGKDEENISFVKKTNEKISKEAARIFEENILIDACAYHLSGENWQTEMSGAAAICFNILEASDTSAEGVLRQIAEYLDVIRKNSGRFLNVRKPEDIEKAKAVGKLGIILSGQTCDFISYKMVDSYVELFARMGLRTMNLAYNHRTFAADGSRSGTDAGLTPQGKELVKAMNRYGITIDLSHVGRQSAKEAMSLTKYPLIYSHSNPEKLFPGSRSVTDEEAKMCADTGGVMCVSGYAPTLYNGRAPATIERFVEAVLYYVDLIGADHVGIGLDSMAEPGSFDLKDTKMMCDRIESHHEDAACYWENFNAGYGRQSVSTIGLYGIANHRNITDSLLKRELSEIEVKKIMGLNLMRVFKETWR